MQRLAFVHFRSVGIAVVAGVLLAILGPFGSYLNGGPILLGGYWIAAMLVGLILYGAAYRVVGLMASPGSYRWWLLLIGAALLVSIPEALVTRAGAFWLWPDLARLRLSLPLWLAQTTVIGLIAMVTMALAFRRASPASGVAQSASSIAGAASRDAGSFGGDVLALQMEDHYVRVHRSTGSELILMPLGDAIGRVDAEGLKVHRSWWVAGHAVVSVEGSARSMRIVLPNGLTAPVARSAVTRLRAAGWIPDFEQNARFPEPMSSPRSR